MPPDPYKIPSRIIAGDTVSFKVVDKIHPATAWTLVFAVSGQVTLSFSATASGDEFEVTMPAKDTQGLPPGPFSAALVFTETASGVRNAFRIGRVFVFPDPTRQRAKFSSEIQLDNLNATIERLTTLINSSTSIAQQAATKLDLEKAMSVRDRLRVTVAAERRKIGEHDQTGGYVAIQGVFR